jgi:hypothetical protein
MELSFDPGCTENPRVRYQNPFLDELPDGHADFQRNGILSRSCNSHSFSNSESSDVALQHTLPEDHEYWKAFRSSRFESPDQTPPPSRASASPNDQQFSNFIATPYSEPLLNQDMDYPLTEDLGDRRIESIEKGNSNAMQQHKGNCPGNAATSVEKISRGTESPNWSRPRDIAFIISVCLAQFLSLACLAQTVAPLSIIGSTFNVDDPGQLSWFTAAYSMTLGAFILPSGLEHRITVLQITD